MAVEFKWNGIQVIICKMSGSKTGSTDLTYSSLGDEVPIVTVPFESSSAQGINIKESPGESSKEQASNMVGWTVYKMYGIHEVKGVVQSYNSETKIYEVRYKDGKSEKVTEDSLVRYLSPCSPEDEKQKKKARPAIMNASNAVVPATKATKRKRGRPAAAKQSKVPAANSSKRAGTAAAQQSKQVSEGSSEVPAANSNNGGKTRYRSLRMNAGR